MEGSVTTDTASSVSRTVLDVERTFFGQISHRDTSDFEVDPRLEPDGVTVGQETIDQRAAHGAGTEHANPNGHGVCLASLCALIGLSSSPIRRRLTNQKIRPSPVRISCSCGCGAGYTDESHGLSVVVVIPVVSQALM